MKAPITLRLLFALAVIFVLAACSQGGGSNKYKCSQNEEFCIDLQMPDSFSLTDAVPVTLDVTASQDIDYLSVAFQTSSGSVQIDGPETWEEYANDGFIDGNAAIWTFSIKAGETLTFQRNLHFPDRDGNFTVIVSVVTKGRSLEASDVVNIQTKNQRGKVYRSGTKVPPMSPDGTAPSYGPGTPAPTWITYPTDTPYPPTEAPDEAAPLTGPIEAVDDSYPAPVTPEPLETFPSYP